MNTENINILAFDTTLDKTYIALQKASGNTKTLDERIIKTDEKNYHSAYLISAIKDIMQKNDLKLQELGLIAVNNGPGSFTGIRVGVTVAKTLSKELGVNILGVSSLDILQKAYGNLAENTKTPISPDVILDARKETFYFKKGNSKAPNTANAGNSAKDGKEDEEILLVPYFEIKNHITKNTVICDASSFPKLQEYLNFENINIINFEEDNINLAMPLLDIAKETAENFFDKDLSWYTLNPRYIQPPPIHKK